jgi:formate dehydrogenase major subunit
MGNHPGVCNYCGTGCGHLLKVEGGAVRGVFPSPEHPVGKGRLCVRGWHIHELLTNGDRIARPLLREAGRTREVGWDEALTSVAGRLADYIGDQIGFWASPRASNEDTYALVRLARAVFRCPNIGLLSDAGHQASARVLLDGAGWPAMTGALADIRPADFILVVGTDLSKQNPIIASEIHFAARGGTHVLVLSSRTTQMARLATTHLRPKPGSLATVLKAMARILIDENRQDADFIARYGRGFDAFRMSLAGFDLGAVESQTGLSLDTLRDATRRLADAPRALAFTAAGVAGPDRDTAALLFDLFLAAGKIGREGCGVNPVTGISNMLGASDMGAVPDMLPGARRLPDEGAAAELGAAWKSGLDARPGRRIDDLLRDEGSALKALVVVDHDDEINLEADAVRNLDYVVYLGAYANPFAGLAHAVLPTTSYGEGDGTYTSAERRIQLNRRKTEPLAEARPAWRVFADLAAKRGQDWGYRAASEVFADIARTVPSYSAVTYDKLDRNFGGLQWPCDAARPQGTPRLLAEDAGRMTFVPFAAESGRPGLSDDFPMALVAGTSTYYWHQNNIMRKTFIPRREYNALLLLYPQGLVEIHPDDAARLGLRDKRPARVVSAKGSMTVAARVTDDVRPGMAYAPYFIGAMIPGFLKPHAVDIERGEDAAIPVRIEKV